MTEYHADNANALQLRSKFDDWLKALIKGFSLSGSLLISALAQFNTKGILGMYTQEQAEKLSAQIDLKLSVMEEVAAYLHSVAIQIDSARWDVLSRYDEKFQLENEAAREFWGYIRDAIEGLYGAKNCLATLHEIETRKWNRVESYLEKLNNHSA